MSRRSELHPVIVQLRAQGLVWREIGERLGISLQTAHEYATDPTGEKAHARKTKARCRDCGTSIRSDHPSYPQLRCVPCDSAHRRTSYKAWVIDRIQDWADRFGDPPTASDWNRAPSTRANHPAAALRQDDASDQEWPCTNGARLVFGSWNAAIRAAGYEPLRSGSGRLTDREAAA